MNLLDLAETLNRARVAYQVELAEGEPYLIDPDSLFVEILFPGQWDACMEMRVDGWTIALGEEGDRKLVRGVGLTLGEAAVALRRAVDERAAKVRALLDGAP